MEITPEIIRRSVKEQTFGTVEPFASGNAETISAHLDRVLTALETLPGVSTVREEDHYDSGYASYVSAFLYPSDGRSQVDQPEHIETTGLLVYVSRLGPVAVLGGSWRAQRKDGKGGSRSLMDHTVAGSLPEGQWDWLVTEIERALADFEIALLPREPLSQPAPEDIQIPTVFDPPYFVFDTLFYWSD